MTTLQPVEFIVVRFQQLISPDHQSEGMEVVRQAEG